MSSGVRQSYILEVASRFSSVEQLGQFLGSSSLCVRKDNMAKVEHSLARGLICITLIAAGFGLSIGSIWRNLHPSEQASSVKDAKQPISPPILNRSQIRLLAESGKIGQANLSHSGLIAASPQRNRIFPLPTLQPDIPTNNIPSPRQALKEPPNNGINSQIPSGEQPDESYKIPPQFQAKIVKKITPIEQRKVIALTFDDGPWPRNTPQILDILRKNNIKATFFWVGQALKDHPQIAKRVVAEGHIVGNHTWHHWYHKLDAATAAREIDDTTELIYKTTGVRTTLFRPPGAVMNNGVTDYAKQKKYLIAMWSNDPMDYRPLSAQQLVNNTLRKAQPGAIVLMHDGGGNHPATVQALPQIIAKLKKLGYSFVTVPELLEMSQPEKSEVIATKQKQHNSDSPSKTKP